MSVLTPKKPRPVKIKMRLVKIIFKYSVPTAKKTQLTSITEINQLMLFKEAVDVYTDNYMKIIIHSVEKNAELRTVKAGGAYTDY
jgi:hypothetical protein